MSSARRESGSLVDHSVWTPACESGAPTRSFHPSMSPAALKGQEAGPVGGLPGLLPLVLGTSQAAEKEIMAPTSCLFRNRSGTS